MKTLANLFFWGSAAALFYTYAGYPLLLLVVSRFRRLPVERVDGCPMVSVIITAYNEEHSLRAKLENTLALDYPPDQLEIIVASDYSNDKTDDIAREFATAGVRLYRQPRRLGKTAAQNGAVEMARGEVLLFSDATTHYQPDVLRRIAPAFGDATVGSVAGRLVYVDSSGSSVGQGARSYWSYETLLKQYESQICSMIGASGCLYAVRRSAYVPLYPEACSDFIIATKMVEQGLRMTYEPEAVCIEETNRHTRREMQMRVRVIAQTLHDLWRHRAMLNPLRSGFFAVQLLSHKVFRYLVPLFLGLLLSSTAALASNWYFRGLLMLQIAGYSLGLMGIALERVDIHSKALAFPQYFLLANFASVAGFYKFLTGERFASWQPIRVEERQDSGRKPAVPGKRAVFQWKKVNSRDPDSPNSTSSLSERSELEPPADSNFFI